LLPLGFPKEVRRFSPHLTVGRTKTTQGAVLTAVLEEHQNHSFGSCSVGEVQIISSELTRRGAVYAELAAVSLR
jgi:2'-5' RNA ligase